VRLTFIRRVLPSDFKDIAALFSELTNEPVAAEHEQFLKILAFPGTQMFGAEVNGQIVAMATLHILPNLGGSRMAYGLVENVVTLAAFQKRGIGRDVLSALVQAAWDAGAYKIMLMTGTGRGARGFYEKCGFSGESKIGMQMRRVTERNNSKPI
jgi:GNAT superfamily N-acetyltransferase